jgi:hypothetical protein
MTVFFPKVLIEDFLLFMISLSLYTWRDIIMKIVFNMLDGMDFVQLHNGGAEGQERSVRETFWGNIPTFQKYKPQIPS